MMSRWLPKEERKKRDDRVVELYNQGFTGEVISLRCGLAAHGGAVNHILVKRGVARNRSLSSEAREERDKRVIEAYHRGESHQSIQLRFKVNISHVLKRHGLKADRR